MIAVDTNVLARIFTRDDEGQYNAAIKLIESHEIFISDSVILETQWVLRYAYEFGRKDISSALRKLFGLKNVQINNPVLVAQAIEWYEKGLDFADAMHLALSQECEKLHTFDEKFIKRASGLGKCSVAHTAV